jgi:uncharacterized protein
MDDFTTFAMIGFVAQLIDSALGMGFGIISASVLLLQGVPPALVSASVNAAKLPTTGTSAMSHLFHKNLSRELLLPVAVFGAIGGAVGALVLASLQGGFLTSLVTVYLLIVGVLIISRGIYGSAPRLIPPRFLRVIGFAGGVFEGIGGSWGPLVTTSLVSTAHDSRKAIGSSNFAEFVVSIAVFLTFVGAYFVGHWEGGADWARVAWPVAGLVVGGIPAAFFGGYILKLAPQRELTVAVGALALGIGLYRAIA